MIFLLPTNLAGLQKATLSYSFGDYYFASGSKFIKQEILFDLFISDKNLSDFFVLEIIINFFYTKKIVSGHEFFIASVFQRNTCVILNRDRISNGKAHVGLFDAMQLPSKPVLSISAICCEIPLLENQMQFFEAYIEAQFNNSFCFSEIFRTPESQNLKF